MSTNRPHILQCRLLTPAGVGAIAVVRVTGDGAWSLVRSFVQPKRRELPEKPEAHRIYFGEFNVAGESLDDVIVAPTIAGATCCGDAVDISCHGGVRVVERIIMALTQQGARWSDREPAVRATEPWQQSLTRLAYSLLPRATTRRGAAFLLEQATVLPEYLDSLMRSHKSGNVKETLAAFEELLDRSCGSEFLYGSADIAIVGPPNVGKSLLANRLAGRDGAIVADGAGTTRDWVRLETAIEGIAVNLIDTAGVRSTEDAIESTAIHAGKQRSASANVFILVLDASADHLPDLSPWSRLPKSATVIAWNKADLLQTPKHEIPANLHAGHIVETSALTGQGFDGLGSAVASSLLPAGPSSAESHPTVFCPELRSAFSQAIASGELSEAVLANAIVTAWRYHHHKRDSGEIPGRTGV